MPLLENLVEGFAGAAGDYPTVNRIEGLKGERRDLAHEELATKTHQVLNDVRGIQDKIVAEQALEKPDPAKLKEYASQLSQAQQFMTDLYHPEKNPGALQHLGGFIKQHLLRRPAAPPATPAQAKASLGQLNAWGAGVGTATDDKQKIAGYLEGPQGTVPYMLQGGRAVPVGVPAGMTATYAPKEPSEAWKPQILKLADGTELSAQYDAKSGQWTDLNGTPIPKERLSGATLAPKTTGTGKYAWTKKNGKFVSVKLDDKGQIIPGSENPNLVPPAALQGRVSEGYYHFIDEKGEVHQVQETRASGPPGSVPNIPQTPAQAKDRVLGFKGNKDYNDTKAAYEGAQDRVSTMEQNLKNAMQGDQQAMLSLVANHIGMTLGLQKGARITRAVWDEAMASAPWLARVASRWSEDGYLSGVTLTSEQMKQMVRLAHEKTGTLKQHLDRLNTERGATPGAATPAKTDKAVSLAAAKQLPAMKGKSDDEIRKAIEASGHQVIP